MAPRRLIICCDGTGQSSTRGERSISTNVSRFCHALSNSHEKPQIVYYQSGVGTGSLGALYQKYAGGTGAGLDDNVLDTYQFVADNFLPGDEIFLFGFSRGAFTVRVLAEFIMNVGLLKKSFSWKLKFAYKAYTEGPEAFKTFCESLKKQSISRYVEIQVLGCWDTVGSVGVPDYWWSKPFRQAFEFYDTSLSAGIKNAFHALALDEIRYPFLPTIMHLPKNEKGEPLQGVNLQQCWFPGVHTNVGGGYADQHLADLTLAWMIDKCRPFLDFEQSYIDMCCKLNHSPESVRSLLKKDLDKKYPGWGMGKIYDSYRDDAMFLLGYGNRTPGEYSGKVVERQLVGETNEEMHASVRMRYANDPKFRKIKALEGFKPVEDANGRWKWVKKTKDGKTVELREAQFESDPKCFERLLQDPTYMAVAKK